MAKNALKRAPTGGLKELKHFLKEAFILPFQDKKRAYIYLTAFLFSFGFSFLDMYLLLDLAGMPMAAAQQYLAVKYIGLMVLVTATILLISRFGGRVIYPGIALLLFAALGYGLYRGAGLQPWETGLLYGVLTSPFWGIFHVIFAVSTSKNNIGNEVSLASTGMTLGMTLGFLIGGVFSATFNGTAVMIAGFACMFFATFALMVYAYKYRLKQFLDEAGVNNETLREALWRCKFRSIGALFDGYFMLSSGNIWILYMSMNGIAAAMVGVWNALLVVIKIIFTPIAGALVNHGQRREIFLGSGVNLIGWVPLLFSTIFILPSMYIWALGTQLYTTGMTSAWYGTRTIASLAVREMMLGVVRVSFVFVLVPLVYATPDHFVMLSVGMAVLMFIYGFCWFRHAKLKGPVMPIESKIVSDG